MQVRAVWFCIGEEDGEYGQGQEKAFVRDRTGSSSSVFNTSGGEEQQQSELQRRRRVDWVNPTPQVQPLGVHFECRARPRVGRWGQAPGGRGRGGEIGQEERRTEPDGTRSSVFFSLPSLLLSCSCNPILVQLLGVAGRVASCLQCWLWLLQCCLSASVSFCVCLLCRCRFSVSVGASLSVRLVGVGPSGLHEVLRVSTAGPGSRRVGGGASPVLPRPASVARTPCGCAPSRLVPSVSVRRLASRHCCTAVELAACLLASGWPETDCTVAVLLSAVRCVCVSIQQLPACLAPALVSCIVSTSQAGSRCSSVSRFDRTGKRQVYLSQLFS